MTKRGFKGVKIIHFIIPASPVSFWIAEKGLSWRLFYGEVPLYGSNAYIHRVKDQEKEAERPNRKGRMLATHIWPLIAENSIQLNSKKPILAIRCGVGAQTRSFRDLIPRYDMICVDREEGYLEQFRKKFRFEMDRITCQQSKCNYL